MNLIIKTILNIIVVMGIGVATALPVMAQSAEQCYSIYGMDSEICLEIEKAPFVLGSIVIDDITLAMIVAVFILALAMVGGASYLKTRVNS